MCYEVFLLRRCYVVRFFFSGFTITWTNGLVCWFLVDLVSYVGSFPIIMVGQCFFLFLYLLSMGLMITRGSAACRGNCVLIVGTCARTAS